MFPVKISTSIPLLYTFAIIFNTMNLMYWIKLYIYIYIIEHKVFYRLLSVYIYFYLYLFGVRWKFLTRTSIVSRERLSNLFKQSKVILVLNFRSLQPIIVKGYMI